MEHAARAAAVTREGGALAAALHAGPVDAPVPSCPDWTLADLAVHAGQFCGFWAHVLCEGTGREKTPFPDPPPGDAVADWFEQQARQLATLVDEITPDTSVWTWKADDQTAGFVTRRSAHELAVHRYDAQLARDACEPIEASLAADGIDEICMMISSLDRVGRGAGETVHLHGTDRPEEWLLALDAGGLRVTREHARADLALRGAVSDLELLLYGRPTLGPVERLGDDSVLDTWYRVFRF